MEKGIADLIEREVFFYLYGNESPMIGVSNSMVIEFAKDNPEKYNEIVRECTIRVQKRGNVIEMSKGCPECKAEHKYSKMYDSYYCSNCDKWLESECNDPNCRYCANRLNNPSLMINKRMEMKYSVSFVDVDGRKDSLMEFYELVYKTCEIDLGHHGFSGNEYEAIITTDYETSEWIENYFEKTYQEADLEFVTYFIGKS